MVPSTPARVPPLPIVTVLEPVGAIRALPPAVVTLSVPVPGDRDGADARRGAGGTVGDSQNAARHGGAAGVGVRAERVCTPEPVLATARARPLPEIRPL